MARLNPEGIVRRARNAITAFNRHNVSAYVAMLDPEYRAYNPGSPEPALKSKEEARATNEGFLTTFPDINFKILNIAARGNTLAVEWVLSGTFKGPLELPGSPPIPPTGGHVEVKLATFYDVNSKGLLAEGRNYFDEAAFYKQLGLKM